MNKLSKNKRILPDILQRVMPYQKTVHKEKNLSYTFYSSNFQDLCLVPPDSVQLSNYGDYSGTGPFSHSHQADGTYNLYFILAGSTRFLFHGKEINACKNDIVLFRKDAVFDFQLPAGVNCRRIGISLCDTAVTALLLNRNSFSEETILHLENMDLFLEKFRCLENLLENQDGSFMTDLSSELYSILLELHRIFSKRVSCTGPDELYHVIQRYPQREYSIASMCASAGCSSNTLYRYFMRKTGMSPLKFVIRMRMSYASYFLKFTRLSNDEIALQCGYSDTSHFIGEFRKYSGTTPGKFRNYTENFIENHKVRFYEENPEVSGMKQNENGGVNADPLPEKSLSARRKDILHILALQSRITQKELAALIGINPSALQKHILYLKEHGFIVRRGSRRSGFWNIRKTGRNL